MPVVQQPSSTIEIPNGAAKEGTDSKEEQLQVVPVKGTGRRLKLFTFGFILVILCVTSLSIWGLDQSTSNPKPLSSGDDDEDSSVVTGSTALYNAVCEHSKPIEIDGSITIGVTGRPASQVTTAMTIPNCPDFPLSGGVWYHVTAPSAGTFVASFDDNWTPVGTYLSVYDQNENSSSCDLACIEGEGDKDDATNTIHTTSATWKAEAPEEEFIILVHQTVGKFGLKVLFSADEN